MAAVYSLILSSYVFTLLGQYLTIVAFTLNSSEFISDGQTLTSQGGYFQLGFFSPSSSSNNRRYLGIWYKTLPVQTVVWVANRDSPIQDTSGVLKISSTGSLVILVNQTRLPIWSTNLSKVVENPILEFLECGNLVLRDSKNADSMSYLWQSFDHPTDTFLPGTKDGWNLKTRTSRYVTSWKNVDDPSSGDFTYSMELGSCREYIIRHGSKKYFRAGAWNGLRASSLPELEPNPKFTYEYVDNAEEVYFTYELVNKSVFVRFQFLQTSSIEAFYVLWTWVEKTNSWVKQFSFPRDRCDTYALCGPYSICDTTNLEVCQCFKGFRPKSPDDWNHFDWSQGCERHILVRCSKGEGFNQITDVKLPDTTTGSWLNTSMNLEECRVKCLNDCSCTAYANSDISEGGSGCILWFTDLSDMRKLNHAGHDFYVRMAASEIEFKSMTVNRILIISVTFVGGVIALSSGSCCIWKRRNLKGNKKKDDLELLIYSKKDDHELPLFDLVTITRATNNFSEEYKLGEGGFGPVYKGVLDGGQPIAVKRLSKESMQGINEFKNEATLILKLQHRNLVRILGCCIEGVEKMLIYEYMQNSSLDSFIFDESKRRLLNWQKRFQIILGIARGLLYLHQDSRLKIIHRDLKPSNILLDSEMVAKISDFGLARIFKSDQTETRTRRVIGTRGYMSPEYAVDGCFSVKSDVFSFGVLVIEIISGKKNLGFSHPGHGLNLLGHSWRLWSEDNTKQLIDPLMNSSSYLEEISRCIHVALLCVQKHTDERPFMSDVVLMLSSEISVPAPQPPGFYIERSITPIGEDSSSKENERCTNSLTMTLLEGR